MEKNEMSVGEIIKNRRQELGLSYRQLGRLLGVSPSTISKWEKGKVSTLREQNIEGLSRHLHLPKEAFDPSSGTLPQEDMDALALRTQIEYQLMEVRDVRSLRLISGIIKEIKKEEWK